MQSLFRDVIVVIVPLLLLSMFAVIGAAAEEPDLADLAAYDRVIVPADREHWSYLPVHRAKLPVVSRKEWVRNPIDAFVLGKLEKQRWTPSAPATKRALLRRVYLDVIGLPPTPKEQQRFLDDDSPTAFEVVVDDLLKRKGYGERWARHWLDAVRYAESNGYERDAIKPSVWRYRDYVIRAFNDDKPYNRFVLEQLAGDELPNRSTETLIATGFHRLGPWDDEPADPQQDRFDQLDDIIRTTSEVFLGMTLGCARCHNHKFDAITMHDYYRMVAVFNGLQRPRSGRTELDLPAGSAEQLVAFENRDQGIAAVRVKIDELRKSFRAEFLTSGESKFTAEALAAFRTEEKKRTPSQKKLVERHAKDIEKEITIAFSSSRKEALRPLEKQIAELTKQTPSLPRAYFLNEPGAKPAASFLLLRGRATNRGPQVQPGFPTVLQPKQPVFSSDGKRTSQRRLKLAKWIIDPQHPLTSRVIVNRVWQHHFGRALVRTPNDFGILGETPTHPELLDWLANWFVQDADWSLKKLHRLFLTSNTYRMSKRWNDQYGKVDPENEMLWRFPYSRLEVEAIRDSMLAASGQLNRKMYGPSTYLYVPKEALDGHSDPGKIWKPFNETEASRRTVYAFIKRSMVVPFLEVLDLCDSTRPNDRRNVTSVPTQALTMFNGDFVNRQASHLARRLKQEAGKHSSRQIERAWQLVLCRAPKADETKIMKEFLVEQASTLSADAKAEQQTLSRSAARHQALVQFCRVLLNTNEFVYPD